MLKDFSLDSIVSRFVNSGGTIPQGVMIADCGKAIIKKANILARQCGFHSATSISFGAEDKVTYATKACYRKITTDEKVSNAYRNNFGWKNTYYSPSTVCVQLHIPSIFGKGE